MNHTNYSTSCVERAYPEIQEKTIQLAFGRINYIDEGNGNSTVLLLHGGYGNWQHWRANIPALAKLARVIAIDMPGFGHSDALPQPTKIENLADIVAEITSYILSKRKDTAKPLRYHILGFSFGAAVAASLAQRHPDQVGNMILLSPPGVNEVTEELLELQTRASVAAREHGLMAGVRITAYEAMLKNEALIDDFVLETIANGVKQCRVHTRNISRAMEILKTLSPFRGKVRLLFGADDPFYRLRIKDFIQPSREVLGHDGADVIRDCAHWIQYEQPQRVLDEAITWFGWQKKL